MNWGRRILIGASIVLVLLIGLVLVAGYLSVDEGSVTQSLSMTVGNRTVTVSGHYKSVTQESLTDGVKVVIDGHEIIVSADQLTVDGKTQVVEPGQDIEIAIGKDGTLSVKLADSAEAAQ